MEKWIKTFFSAVVTLGLVILLGHWWSNSLPPLGRLLSPQEGFWQNAEAVGHNFSGRIILPGLSDSASVWFDERLVPHIFATNERDLYFIQGYITAEFRLWQMELQVRAAAGRVSEILGPAALNFDRLQRRKGIGTAAEAAYRAMQSDSLSNILLNSYTAGVNAWISSLDYRHLPLEYKLLGYTPEPWEPRKCALLTRYMSDMLTGDVNAIENTNARHILSQHDFDLIYPDFFRQLDPIVPQGTSFGIPTRHVPSRPGNPDIAGIFGSREYFEARHDPDNGSNNWAVNGKKTQSGVPILCNDPHLDLHLPSIWYELQLSCGRMNVYGVSLPGAPGVIIGFNDSIAWGETNAERDVKDYYAIQFRDSSRREYAWKQGWKSAEMHPEQINIRGQKPFYDTVAYTVFGPVVYDASFPNQVAPHQSLAACWVSASPSNEGRSVYLLNHASGYSDYLAALQFFESPGQNFAYADKKGNIAIWEQGKFPILSKGQGKFIMPGQDSSWAWQGYIPYRENPHLVNPSRNFISSANQQPTDSSYPYYYSGDFKGYRGHRINQVLGGLQHITVDDMEALQTDVYNSFAAEALPFMIKYVGRQNENSRWLDTLRDWDFKNEAFDWGPTLFQLWWDSLYADVWSGFLPKVRFKVPDPDDKVTVELLLSDTSLHFLDHIRPRFKDFMDLDSDAFRKAAAEAARISVKGRLAWGFFQGTNIMHLAQLPAFSAMDLFTSGGEHIVNATKKTHGPSWRMVVELSDPVHAYGIFPGGESGNPGSLYYQNMVSDWVKGKYYPLHVMRLDQPDNPDIRYTVQFLR
jgi:penicillin amidase